MHRRLGVLNLLFVLALFAVACQPAAPAAPAKDAAPAKPAEAAKPAAPAAAPAAPAAAPAKPAEAAKPGASRIAIGITNPLESQDPLDHSDTFLYPFWCQVAGCLLSWDPKTGNPLPQLMESWKNESPTTWLFSLRKDAKWSDGTAFTSADVVYTLQKVIDHPKGKQKYRLSTVSKFEAVDANTVRLITKEPNSELLDAAFVVGLPMLSKAQGDKGDDLSKVKALAAGPYELKEYIVGQRAVISKIANHWSGPNSGADEVIYRYIKEDQARVTALLNDEIQIAQNVPPQDVARVNASPNAQVSVGDSLTIMFLAMRGDSKPWDNKLVRQAVAYAIDRDAIIKGVLQGQADKLEGPIGPGQYAYDPNLQPRYTYDPAKAKELLAQAGFPNGVEVEFSTPVNFYVKDKEITEAIVPMLNAAGIKARLLTPEWATLWGNIQEGKVPFFYIGRGQVRDPGQPLSQYFETGISKRIGYSNPKLDDLFKRERAAFDPNERKKLLGEAMSMITDEAPGVFLWRHKLLWGTSKSIEWTPRSDEGLFGAEMRRK